MFLNNGEMISVIKKDLSKNKYPNNKQNLIELRTDPILIQLDGKNILIDTGIGNNKLTKKQRRNVGVLEESLLDQSLIELGLDSADIDLDFMTHLHFDHACGLTKRIGNEYVAIVKNTTIRTA